MKKRSKGFTLIEVTIVLAVVCILILIVLDSPGSEKQRFENCIAESSFLSEEERKPYCLDKMSQEDYNTALIISNV